ncbi:hypothetical protein [Roseateles sp. P5_E4]
MKVSTFCAAIGLIISANVQALPKSASAPKPAASQPDASDIYIRDAERPKTAPEKKDDLKIHCEEYKRKSGEEHSQCKKP